MSSSFDVVDEKLREADFFLTKMEETGHQTFPWRFYFSAFATATRSITFVLQYAMNGIEGFSDWYRSRQAQLQQDPLSRYFTGIRNEIQKKGTNPVTIWGTGCNGEVEAYFLHWYGDPEHTPPDCDVVSACKKHMKALAALVYEVYRDFGHFIDPAVVYTPDGAAKQGLAIEDIEEALIGARGWTHGLALEERFRLLRQNEPMPQVDDLLIKYLGHDRFGKKINHGSDAYEPLGLYCNPSAKIKMNTTLFHCGGDFFQRFKISEESIITFTDYCQQPIFTMENSIKFTPKALLFLHSEKNKLIRDEWIEEDVIEFFPWDNVLNIQNIDGRTILQEFKRKEIAEWLSSLPYVEITFPFLQVREGNVACIFEGRPKSARSQKGKERLKEEVRNLKSDIQKYFPTPVPDHVEMMIDVFSSNPKDLPDVDRLSISIMDAFEGVVYISDKQVRHLRPRVIDTSNAYASLECATDPMTCLQIENIPSGSLYPLAKGVLDYYVVRLVTFYR